MSDWFTTSPESLIAIAISAVGVYAAVLVYTRLAGLRSFAKMSSFDFAMTVAVGSILASAILTKSPSLSEALVALAMIYALQWGIGKARHASSAVQHVIDNEPILLMDGAEMQRDAMQEVGVTEEDIWAKLREANVLNVDQVRAVVMETTGDVSVLHGDADGTPLQARILTGVRGASAP